MRSHTLSAHKMRITKYKEVYGPLNLLEEVWHACYLCGQLVLLDNDHLGSHIKSAHKLAEKTYKDQYIVSNKKAQHQDCEGNKRGDEKEMSKTRAGGGGKVADVVAQRRRKSVKRRDASMMKNKQKELKRKVGLKEKQERLQGEKKIVKKVDTSASMVAENPKFRSARKTVKKFSIGNPRGQSRSVSRYYRSLTESRPSQRRPRTREPISKREINSFGGKDKSVKTALSKGLIGGEKQLNFVEGKPFVCKEKDCGKAFRYKCNLRRHNLLVHAKERNFSCPAPGCGKDFGTRASLERHMTIHGEQVSKIPLELETPVDRMTVNWRKENQAVPQSGSLGNEDMKKFAPQNIQISNKEEDNEERWKEIVPENWEDTFYPFLDVFYECAVPDCPDCEKLGML